MVVAVQAHSWWSFLEGTASPAGLVAAAARCKLHALALTDVNSLCGAVEFQKLGHQAGIRPLVGVTLRLADAWCVVLPAEKAAWAQLCRLVTRACEHGHTPGPSQEQGQKQGQGLKAEEERANSAGGLASGTKGKEVPASQLWSWLLEDASQLLILVPWAAPLEMLARAHHGRVWGLVVRPAPDCLPPGEERRLIEMALSLNLPLAASSGAVLASANEYQAYRHCQAIARGLLLDALPQRLSWSSAHHLADWPEMRRRFRDLPNALAGAQTVAERAVVDLLPTGPHLPRAKLRGGLDAPGLLKRRCERGLRMRGLEGQPHAWRRLAEEFVLIAKRGLEDYFLLVQSIARHARSAGHTLALRGSAGNSLVCYLLGITDVDPLRFDLPLARFLHEGRVDYPDIDLDFDWKVRDEAIDWAISRFGEDRCVRIASHQLLQPRSAFREACKLHGLSDTQVSALESALPARAEQVVDSDKPVPPPRLFPLEPDRWPRLLQAARLLVGRPRHQSLHPGGIVITIGPARDHVPVIRSPMGYWMTQLDKDGVESLGLVKIDLLGNRALGAIDEASQLVASQGYRLPALADPDATDVATINLVRQGDTLGVVQLESPAMRHLLVQMRAASVESVIESLALVRPAAGGLGMKDRFARLRLGLDPAETIPEFLRRLLPATHGIMVFEDDSLRVIQGVMGLPAPQADAFRKRVARCHDPVAANALREEFLRLARGAPMNSAELAELWVLLERFNQYSFCKSHAVSYGLIAWRSAWLKANHPRPFWTAVLNNNQGMYPTWVYTEAARRDGISILPPCVNRSAEGFQLEPDGIRVGLSRIAGLDGATMRRLLDHRAQHGQFDTLADLRCRVSPGPQALGLLAAASALELFDPSHHALMLQASWQDRARMRPDSPEIFPTELAPPWRPPPPAPLARTRDEFQLLGLSTRLPLPRLFASCVPTQGPKGYPITPMATLRDRVGQRVTVVGLMSASRNTHTVQGKPMQFISLADETGMADLTLMPGGAPTITHPHLGPWMASGEVEQRYDVITLAVGAIEPLRRQGQELPAWMLRPGA